VSTGQVTAPQTGPPHSRTQAHRRREPSSWLGGQTEQVRYLIGGRHAPFNHCHWAIRQQKMVTKSGRNRRAPLRPNISTETHAVPIDIT